MNEQESRLLGEKGLAFFGVVTASISHEINNAIAIIGELSGLLDDLLLAAERGRAIDHDKLKAISHKIANQVDKGQRVIKGLNRFAHSIDEPVKEFDLGELLREITAIAQRFAFLKGVRLETDVGHESLKITSSPFRLQQAVFKCVELALGASDKDDTVTVALNQDGSAARIVTASAPLETTEEVNSKLSFLSILMKQLGGSVEARRKDERQELILSVPRSIDG